MKHEKPKVEVFKYPASTVIIKTYSDELAEANIVFKEISEGKND